MDRGIVLGLDIGYSNLCLAFDSPDGRQECGTLVMPAGAGPADRLPETIGDTSGRPDCNGWRVPVREGLWAAGVEPGRLQGSPRDLHADYTASDTYQALFLAALSATGAARIRHLVTGLPVSHYQRRRDPLARRLRGAHRLGADRHVSVERVTVLPQPAGAYVDFLDSVDHVELAERGRILVVDVGFFSVDWVLIEGGEIRNAASGSSLLAMSVLFRAADELLQKRNGCQVGIEHLERVAREGWGYFYAGGERIATDALLAEAAAAVAPRALAELRQAIRAEHAIDGILLAGGGAPLFEPHVQSTFPGSRALMSDRPVVANARGFWLLEQN